MGTEAALNLEVAAVVFVALIIVVVAAIASGACSCGDAAGATVRVDVERALGDATLMTYEQAAKKASLLPPPPADEQEEECCAICLSKYAKADELVRVVPACGHFFHAECDIDRWLRTRRTCPLCRGELWPRLPRLPRPECAPMQPRVNRVAVVVAVV